MVPEYIMMHGTINMKYVGLFVQRAVFVHVHARDFTKFLQFEQSRNKSVTLNFMIFLSLSLYSQYSLIFI